MLFQQFMIMMETLKEFTWTVIIMKRLCDETFGITKYCLDLEIEILDIYPFIALV